MPAHNARNERIKREYFAFLKEAKRQSEPTVDATAKALHRFEVSADYRDFKKFHVEQAIAFKRHLAEQNGQRSGERLSKATLHSTLTQLKRFFQWLALQPGYRSQLKYSDAEYFNLSDKDARVATTRRERRAPTPEQIKHAINSMPNVTEIDHRDRALVAFTFLTGARDSAIASMKLKHVDLATSSIYQDARDVKTKFSKTFRTFFFPVGDDIRKIVVEWVIYLRETKLWLEDAPLFPATCVELGKTRQFEVSGLKSGHWRNTSPIRTIFREAFTRAGLPYFNPHSFRNTLVQIGQQICRTPEEFKAWSQNLGHEGVLTTFLSYGAVASDRQRAIMRALDVPPVALRPEIHEIAEAVFRRFRDAGLGQDRASDLNPQVRNPRVTARNIRQSP